MIKTTDLTIGSHYKVNVQCDICGTQSIVQYRQLNGKGDYLCNSCAGKNKVKRVYTRLDIDNMVLKIKKTIELKIKENPNYLLEIKGKIKEKRNQNKKNYNVKVSDKKIDKEKVIRDKPIKKSKDKPDKNNSRSKKHKNKKSKEEINEIIKKRKLTKLIKYGDENYNNQDKKEIHYY